MPYDHDHTLPAAPATDNLRDPQDITDWWIQATGEDDQEAVAHFNLNEGRETFRVSLVGISITEGEEVTHYDIAGAALFFGDDVIAIERWYEDHMQDVYRGAA